MIVPAKLKPVNGSMPQQKGGPSTTPMSPGAKKNRGASESAPGVKYENLKLAGQTLPISPIPTSAEPRRARVAGSGVPVGSGWASNVPTTDAEPLAGKLPAPNAHVGVAPDRPNEKDSDV